MIRLSFASANVERIEARELLELTPEFLRADPGPLSSPISE
jgi:hypothetical protein